MTIWNVSPEYIGDSTIAYMVLPYNLAGTVKCFLGYDTLRGLVYFLFNSRLTERSARRYEERKKL